MMSSTRRWVTHIVLLASLAGVVLTGCTGQGTDDTVTVLASWTGAEEDNFKAVLARFTENTGIRVEYQGTRAARQVLFSEVQKGTPPDVAVLPNPSEMAAYLDRNLLKPLTEVPDSSASPQWLQLERLGRETDRYVVPVKADLKSLIWYDRTRLPELMANPPQRWTELVELSRSQPARGSAPWCLGMAAIPDAGWPGTDWIEDILLHQSNVEIYQMWAAGDLSWNSDEVKRAWQAWGDLVAATGMVRGGATAALLTDFRDAGRPMFTDPPGCMLHHQASFLIGIHQGYKPRGVASAPGANADFFPFPVSDDAPAADQRNWVVSADVAGLFTDRPQGRALIEFLATDEAQQIWPDAGNGSVFSVNQKLAVSGYDEVGKRIADTLTSSSSRLCFDASDLMPATMASAFQQAALEYYQRYLDYYQGRPDRLATLMQELDQIRRRIKDTGRAWLNLRCAT